MAIFLQELLIGVLALPVPPEIDQFHATIDRIEAQVMMQGALRLGARSRPMSPTVM